ncbi:MAG: hypothetical protein PHN22_05080 [Candidatus ainarchaeum sp.]|nr:hypothetical protein [Candidatus ainarchaeum sp.]
MKEDKVKKPKLKTQLESAGAEYLVLGELLRRRIQAFIVSQNFEAYDIVAVNTKKNLSVKIQVKSRFIAKANGFPIHKIGTDFVVFVRLNITKKTNGGFNYSESPEFFILPILEVKKKKSSDKYEKANFKKTFLEQYKNKWDLINKELKM